MESASTIRSWEAEEIERSSVEAARTSRDRLTTHSDNVKRYLAPPPDTAFPLEYAFHLIGNLDGKTVLDFGCGSGNNCVPLIVRRARVVGLDVSHDLLRLAQERVQMAGFGGGARFVAASGRQIPLPEASIDAVLGIAVLHHLSVAEAASEIHRVLRPGGHAVFQEPMRNSTGLRLLRSAIPYRDPEVSEFERPLTDADLRIFRELFTHYRERNFSLPFINVAQVVRPLRKHLHRFHRLDRTILKHAPWLTRYAGVRVFSVTK